MRKLRCRIVLVIGVIAVAVGVRIKMRGDHSRISGWQRREVVAQRDVATHRDRDHASIVNRLRSRLDPLERIGDPARRHPNVAAVDEAEAFHSAEVGEFGTVASRQNQLAAY